MLLPDWFFLLFLLWDNINRLGGERERERERERTREREREREAVTSVHRC